MKAAEAQVVCTVADGPEILGYLVIDSTVGGQASGGLRLLPDVDEAEIRRLARAMTLKYGLLGLPRGGAKAGVRGDPEAPLAERRERLIRFGQAIAPLIRSRIYVPGTDMGTTNDDLRAIYQALGMRIKHRELSVYRSGTYTAWTVFASAKQAARHRGLSLAGMTAAIEGFGKVGGPLAELLAEAGVRVVAVSTSRGAIYDPQGLDVARLRALAAEHGSRMVEGYADVQLLDPAALLELEVDLLCPCARHDSIHAGNAPRIAARILCPGANNPVTPEAEQTLFERGVLCLPDFVTNCGGVLGGTMEFAAVRPERIARFIEQHIGARVAGLLEEAARQQVLPRQIAVPLALQRFEQVRCRADRPTLTGRLFGVGLELYRRGWIPGSPVAALSLPYFERSLA